MRNRSLLLTHAILLLFAVATLAPFVIVLLNSMRDNAEYTRNIFGAPESLLEIVEASRHELSGAEQPDGAPYREVVARETQVLTSGYRLSWPHLRPYLLNTFLVAGATIAGVVLLSSISAYVFSRYRFPGHNVLFSLLLSIMMVPGILTLVPSFLLVKQLGLLNSYWVLILPYIATGQIMAIFLFKTFFDGLPRELFESARIDGAGHVGLYLHIVMPLSKPVVSVVTIITLMGAWNNFLWPFVANSDSRYHVITSGLFVLTQTMVGANYSTINAAIILASLPPLVLFLYATRPFIAGLTSGALK